MISPSRFFDAKLNRFVDDYEAKIERTLCEGENGIPTALVSRAEHQVYDEIAKRAFCAGWYAVAYSEVEFEGFRYTSFALLKDQEQLKHLIETTQFDYLVSVNSAHTDWAAIPRTAK